jgi:hypothetical protein
MLIVFNQVLPVINGGSIKLWPIFGISIHPTHLHKLWQPFCAMPLVGDKAAAAHEGMCWLTNILQHRHRRN